MGSEKEEALPDSIIKQFILSVMNMNSNASFPKWLKKEQLSKINRSTFIMFGEYEFAFSINKAIKRAEYLIRNVEIEIVKEASHLLSVSKAEYINEKVLTFVNKL